MVADLNMQFDALLGCAPCLRADQQVMIYTTNIQETLTLDVHVWCPTSLMEVIGWACIYERHANWALQASNPAKRASNASLQGHDILPAPNFLPPGGVVVA